MESEEDYFDPRPVNPRLLDENDEFVFQNDLVNVLQGDAIKGRYGNDHDLREGILALSVQDPTVSKDLAPDEGEALIKFFGQMKSFAEKEMLKCENEYLGNVATRNFANRVIRDVTNDQRQEYTASWKSGIPPRKRKRR